jgi:hypothetical protein
VPTVDEPRRKGAISLDISNGELSGRYWNDIGERGLLTSNGRTRKSYDTYSAAAQGTYRAVAVRYRFATILG